MVGVGWWCSGGGRVDVMVVYGQYQFQSSA